MNRKDTKQGSFTPPQLSFLQRLKHKIFGVKYPYRGNMYGYKGRK